MWHTNNPELLYEWRVMILAEGSLVYNITQLQQRSYSNRTSSNQLKVGTSLRRDRYNKTAPHQMIIYMYLYMHLMHNYCGNAV